MQERIFLLCLFMRPNNSCIDVIKIIHIDQSGMITFNNPFAVLTLKFVVQAPYLVGLLLSWFDTVDRVVFDVPGIAWWITSFLQALHYV